MYFYLKITIYMDLESSREESAAEDRNTKTKAATAKIGGGNPLGSPP
jgi:hypothetical protein